MIADAIAVLGLVVMYAALFWWVPATMAQGTDYRKQWLLMVARTHVWVLLLLWFGYSLYWLFEVLT